MTRGFDLKRGKSSLSKLLTAQRPVILIWMIIVIMMMMITVVVVMMAMLNIILVIVLIILTMKLIMINTIKKMVIVNNMTKKMVMITTMTMKLMIITAMLPTSSPLSARHEASPWRWRLPRRRHQGNRGPHLADQTTFVVMNISIIIILTRPKPAYGRQGLAGFWGQDTDQAGSFWGVLNVSLRAYGAQLVLD